MTSNGSGRATDGSLTASTLFPVPDSSTASRAAESSGIIAFDLSGDPLSGALFNVPTGMDLPAVGRPDTDDVAITNLGLVLAYNLIGSEPQISNLSFLPGSDGEVPRLPMGRALSVPEPVTLLLLVPAAGLALRRRRRAKAMR